MPHTKEEEIILPFNVERITVNAKSRRIPAYYTLERPVGDLATWMRGRAELYEKAASELRKCADTIEQEKLDLGNLVYE